MINNAEFRSEEEMQAAEVFTTSAPDDNKENIHVPATINKLAEEAYKNAADSTGIESGDLYFSRNCEQVSDELLLLLNQNGVPAEKRVYNGWDVTNHDFVIADISGETNIIDPTWQQFLPSPNPEFPKVLICPLKEAGEVLESYGISKELQHVWQVDNPKK